MSCRVIDINVPKRAFLPCYQKLIYSKADINFLWGGRDSGKSRHIAQQLILCCLRSKYFRCVLVRKIFNTIKESQWQLLKDVVEEWGLQDFFTFTQSPLEIRCSNGNKFICRGMDDPGRLKSVSNPSHCWAEEMNQLDKDDFIVIMTSLRYNQGQVEVWCSFNPECDGDYEEFWLYKTFFANGEYNFNSTWTIDMPAAPIYSYTEEDGPGGKVTGYSTASQQSFTYTSTHTTYHHNKFCKPTRAAFLEHLAVLDPYYYQVYTLGKWGKRSITDPFCYCYSKEKHVKPVTISRAHELILSFDFNVNPITCGVYQHYNNWIYGIRSIKLENSDIYKLCEFIAVNYPGYMYLVTGDATGRNTTALVQDGINYYTVIKSKLNLSSNQIKTPSINPKIEENRMLVNSAFHDANIALDPVGCKELIFDCEYVSVDAVGKIEKGDRANPKKRADHLDHFRYYLNTFHKGLLRT